MTAPTTLIVPFAGGLSEAGQQAAHDLPLPQLEKLLARLAASTRDEADAFALSPPHERAQAQASGWPLADGLLPLAADTAQRLQLPGTDAGSAWGCLTPVHLRIGAEQVTLPDPAELQLTEADAQALFDTVAPLFIEEGFALHRTSPLHWLATHPSLATLPTASLDRAIGRDVAPWLPTGPASRLWRRLQNEVQMSWHEHPVNTAREAAGLAPINSLWLSGTGVAPTPGAARPEIDDRLRTPALQADWVAWREAWAALDAGPIARLNQRPAAEVRLVLCGETAAQTFEAAPRAGLLKRLTRRWQSPSAQAVLESL